jgi:carboxylesterase type B
VIQGRATSPTVVLSPSNTVIGLASGDVEKFAGIRFADPPTGSLRLKPPQKLSTNLGDSYEAINPAAACPQMLVSTGEDQSLFFQVVGDLLDSTLLQKATNQSEDCLTVSVIRPAGVTAGANLPVLFWIFGGAFEVSPNLQKPV